MESVSTLTNACTHAIRDLFVSLFDSFDSAGIEYVIVGRTEGYPDRIASDVDIVVRGPELERVRNIVWQWREGAALSQILQHEIEALYFVLTARCGNHFAHFHPDVSADYRRGTRCWLAADYLLADRIRDPAGFWIPAPPAAFAYYLVKRIDKLSLNESHARYLRDVLKKAPRPCEDAGRRLLGDAAWDALVTHLDKVAAIPEIALRDFQRALVDRAPREPFVKAMVTQWRELKRVSRRIFRPTGLVVAILGPDGAGKSTVIEGMRKELAQAFRRTDYFHLRPRLVRRSGPGSVPGTNPHGLPTRGKLASLAKLCMFVLDTWIGQLFLVAALRRRSSLVIFDRYAHDMLADPLRYRLSTPRWLNAFLLRPVPLPDLFLVLDAPAPVLLARKGEVTAAACADQILGYRRLLREMPHSTMIDTEQPPEASIADACEAVLARMRERLIKPVI